MSEREAGCLAPAATMADIDGTAAMAIEAGFMDLGSTPWQRRASEFERRFQGSSRQPVAPGDAGLAASPRRAALPTAAACPPNRAGCSPAAREARFRTHSSGLCAIGMLCAQNVIRTYHPVGPDCVPG